MFIPFIFIVLISIIYFIIIFSFFWGWNKIKVYRKGNLRLSGFFISVIVPFKNEEKNLIQLINSLSNQTLDNNLFEILLVNDNSTDDSMHLALQNTFGKHNFQCIRLSGKSGKKNAIKLGIENSKGDIIVTTDADCTHHAEWLETIYAFYAEFSPKMMIGPVIMQGYNMFEKIQSIDFFALIASGAGACGINRPIMCNGANLTFEKEVFINLQDPLNQYFESGDDVFLLHKVKQTYPGKVLFLKSENAVVNTKAEETLGDFFRQRIRWASKTKGYTDKDTIITAIVVLVMNFSMLLNLILSLINFNFLYLFIIQFIIKSIIDLLLLFKIKCFYKQKKLLYYFIPAQLINIFLIPLVAISGFGFKTQWKDKNNF
jgi:poly-beta-1,6-N-acetyl-D-glucosamine synthase